MVSNLAGCTSRNRTRCYIVKPLGESVLRLGGHCHKV